MRNERVASTGASWPALRRDRRRARTARRAADGGDGHHAGGGGGRSDGCGLLDDDDPRRGVGALQRARLVGQDRDGVDLLDAVGLVHILHPGRS